LGSDLFEAEGRDRGTGTKKRTEIEVQRPKMQKCKDAKIDCGFINSLHLIILELESPVYKVA